MIPKKSDKTKWMSCLRPCLLEESSCAQQWLRLVVAVSSAVALVSSFASRVRADQRFHRRVLGVKENFEIMTKLMSKTNRFTRFYSSQRRCDRWSQSGPDFSSHKKYNFEDIPKKISADKMFTWLSREARGNIWHCFQVAYNMKYKFNI